MGLAPEPICPHWPPNCAKRGMTVWCTVPSAAVSGMTASTPAMVNTGMESAPWPRKSETWPCRTADPNQRRLLTFGTGPPSDPSKRLKPTLMAFPNGSSVSPDTEPEIFSPPALVV